MNNKPELNGPEISVLTETTETTDTSTSLRATLENRPAAGGGRMALGWGILVLLVALAGIAGWMGEHWSGADPLPRWVWMWLLAGGMWGGFKVIAWLRAGGWRVVDRRTLGFAAWVGMDAGAFRKRGTAKYHAWIWPAVSLALGAVILWGITPLVDHPVLRGWLGMISLLMALHFGAFDLVAAFWNRFGYHVRPIMAAPWRARSLTEFWSERWNRAFSDIGRIAVFRPVTRRFGIAAGTLAGFAFSGLAHELVISVPAGAGYGLPTAYFLLQGAGVLAERRFRFRGTAAGRVWTFAVVLAPAFWLFHPPFMTEVIHPFLEAITP